MILNSEQQAAVNVKEGQYALIAGPGSGKTRVLTERYQRLIDSGCPPYDILNLTFTKEAADSMMRRAKASKEQFCTFHSLGYRICNTELGQRNVEPEIRHRLLCKLCKKWGTDYKELAAFISKCRRNNISPAETMEKDSDYSYAAARAYNEYEVERRAAGWMDFDSMLVEAVNLLDDPEVRARYQYRFVQIDESQDTEACQWRMARLLTEKHNNILAVGDRNQAIYGFRDAVVDFESLMKSIWPNTQVLYLGRNYRSHSKIVDYVRKKAPHVSELNNRMISARTDVGPDVEYRMFNNESDEAESALACALKDPTNSAILARTNRMLAPLENLCLTHNIKFHLLGRSGFWKQTEILKAMEKLRQSPSLPLPTAVSLLWPQLEAHYRVEDMTEKDNDALENLKTLRDISRKFKDVPEFVGYANRAAHAKHSIQGVTLSTVHQAKGTEYENVFVIGCRAEMIPHIKGNLDEERRIFFVACSRAKDRLRLSFAGTPSMFISPDLSSAALRQLETERENVERIRR